MVLLLDARQFCKYRFDTDFPPIRWHRISCYCNYVIYIGIILKYRITMYFNPLRTRLSV